MKITVIGDIHGKDIWKQIVNDNPDTNLFVFLGDYFDCFEPITTEQQVNNFKDIIEFKKQNPERVVVLVGNHDFHYMEGVKETYSGYQKNGSWVIQLVLKEALPFMQMCHIQDGFMFTHAGVSDTWLKNVGYDFDNPAKLDEFINDLFKYKPLLFRFTVGSTNSDFGDDVTQTPIWIRHKSLQKVGNREYVQVIGHTHSPNITFLSNNIVCVDSLPYEYLDIVEGKTLVKQLPFPNIVIN